MVAPITKKCKIYNYNTRHKDIMALLCDNPSEKTDLEKGKSSQANTNRTMWRGCWRNNDLQDILRNIPQEFRSNIDPIVHISCSVERKQRDEEGRKGGSTGTQLSHEMARVSSPGTHARNSISNVILVKVRHRWNQ